MLNINEAFAFNSRAFMEVRVSKSFASPKPPYNNRHQQPFSLCNSGRGEAKEL